MSAINKLVITEDEIARRAYQIYLRRGSKNGRDVDDWLIAEKELSEQDSLSPQKTRTTAAGQGQSASVAESDSKRSSPVHHDRIDPSWESQVQFRESCGAEVNRNEILKGKVSVSESARPLLRKVDESVKAPRDRS